MAGFSFASLLDLNMGYYHIKIDADAQNPCTNSFQLGKYKYKQLHIGIKIAWILIFSILHVKACPIYGIC
jgi:hypothetical protein